MALGLGVLALTPLVFWALTPRELDVMLRGRFGTAQSLSAMTREDLSALMTEFPDRGGL